MHVFISYARLDAPVALELHDRLVAAGLTAWIDQHAIRPGTNYAEEIAKAIRAAGVLVLVFTPSANASKEIHKEIQLAANSGVPIVPLRLADVAYHPALDYHLGSAHWVDGTVDGFRALDALVAYLKAAAAEHQAPATGGAPPFPSATASVWRRYRAPMAVAVLLLLAAATAWMATRPAPVSRPGSDATTPPFDGSRLSVRAPAPSELMGGPPATDASPPAARGPRVAVMYFDFGGGDDRLAGLRKGLADMMVSGLRATGSLDLVERERLEGVLGEIRFQQGTTVDPATAVRIGKLLGAEYFVFGSFFELLGTLRIDAKLVEVETGRITASVGADGPTASFSTLQADLTTRLGAALTTRSAPPPTGPGLPTDAVLAYSLILDGLDGGRQVEAMKQLRAFRLAHPDFQPAQRLARF